ncbi:MAG: 4-alpha-glucanotransferase [Lachnospiraceae bacterium]
MSHNAPLSTRSSGILLHPTSFPSPYGIGDLGSEAYHFVDFLKNSGQHLWQVLPLTHTGYGDSPYQSFSAFAGQPLLISPDHLLSLGLLTASDVQDCPVGDQEHIDYGVLIPWKTKILKMAYTSWRKTPHQKLLKKYEKFCEKNDFWLSDYAFFMACKDVNNGKSWLEWDPALTLSSLEMADYYRFVQFFFFLEWSSLKKYANQQGIQIIGDIPIFVSMDSADVWAHKKLFQLDECGYPTCVAGVPPDYFSEDGQLWGNPLYNWNAHQKEKYAWWISRMKYQLTMFDYIRVDHFRGFESYWAVPYGEKTAVNGTWKKGPGKDLFLALEHALGKSLPIIAEDLGVITPKVEKLRDRFHFPGMKILQFAFEDIGENNYLPHQFTTTNCVCYTGTHDNDTTAGWYETLNAPAKQKVIQYTGQNALPMSLDFIRMCLSTIASTAVFPLQDALALGKEARMNTPGVPSGNWNWRYSKEMLTDALAKDLKELTELYGR